ncbi:MAG: WbqC family protein [Cyclobacteriaceae bacterium]
MIISIHQPHFLPWLGYFNKVFNSDIFVWLHNVQFRKNYFQNRTKIKNSDADQELWLTIPVKASIHDNIDQVKVADIRWAKKARKTIEQCYRKTPYFGQYFEPLTKHFETSEYLDDINYKTFMVLLHELNYHGKIVRMDELNVDVLDPNLRLIEICKRLECNHYIAGKGGKNYLNSQQWNDESIKVSWQSFNSETLQYPQLGKSFVHSLSVIDCLFNNGPDKTRELIVNAWQVER